MQVLAKGHGDSMARKTIQDNVMTQRYGRSRVVSTSYAFTTSPGRLLFDPHHDNQAAPSPTPSPRPLPLPILLSARYYPLVHFQKELSLASLSECDKACYSQNAAKLVTLRMRQGLFLSECDKACYPQNATKPVTLRMLQSLLLSECDKACYSQHATKPVLTAVVLSGLKMYLSDNFPSVLRLLRPTPNISLSPKIISCLPQTIRTKPQINNIYNTFLISTQPRSLFQGKTNKQIINN